MKERKQLRVGDTVLWRGFPPEVPTQTAQVEEIRKDAAADFAHDGPVVPTLAWKQAKKAIVLFTNGHWDVGTHIRPFSPPKRWY